MKPTHARAVVCGRALTLTTHTGQPVAWLTLHELLPGKREEQLAAIAFDTREQLDQFVSSLRFVIEETNRQANGARAVAPAPGGVP